MRILVTSAPMHGHVLQLIPLTWALRNAGHEVLMAVPAGITPVVIEAGLPVAETAPAVSMSRMIGFDRKGNPVPWPADHEAKLMRSGRGFARLAALTLERTAALVDRWRPDLVMSEPTEYAGPLAAAVAGVPVVEHGWGLTLSPLYRKAATEELAPELERLGLPGLPRPELVIDVCPPRMQHATAPVSQRMRYVPYNGSTTLPDWVHRPRSRPRVCVTLGSTLPRTTGPFMRDLLSALCELDIEIVVAMDDALVPEIGPLGPRVRAAGWLPLNAVLPECDLTVHHGGPGSTMTSLVYGLPQLALPHASDMSGYAERLRALGAGQWLSPAEATAERIVDRCRALLTDGSYRAAARSLAEEIAAQPSPRDVVPALERVAGRAL